MPPHDSKPNGAIPQAIPVSAAAGANPATEHIDTALVSLAAALETERRKAKIANIDFALYNAHMHTPEGIDLLAASIAQIRELSGRRELNPALLSAPPTEKTNEELSPQDALRAHEQPDIHEEALLTAPPPADPAADEVSRFIDFVLNDAHERYRGPLKELYITWQDYNEAFFKERLQVPHLTIAAGPPQALGFFKSLTDYGGRTQLTIDSRVLSARRKFVIEPWPAEGTRWFVKDLLLHEMIHQYLAEIEHFTDEENAKHGEGFADVCNRIGKAMGLPKVYTRRRCPEDVANPLTNAWPINVRPEGYYLRHVIPPRQTRTQRSPTLRGIAGALSLFRYYVESGQTDKLVAIVRRESEQTHEQSCTAKLASEKGEVSRFNPAWLTWNNGCVQQLLHAIHERKMLDLMPLLADALEAAGCGDELLLTHCRQPVRHRHDCWVIKALRRG